MENENEVYLTVIRCLVDFILFWGFFFWFCRHLNMNFLTWYVHCTISSTLLHTHELYSCKWFQNVRHKNEIFFYLRKRESKSRTQHKMLTLAIKPLQNAHKGDI